MTTTSWNDGLGHRSRRAWLLLVDATGRLHAFEGATIPGVVAIVGTNYHKNGKWSSTTFRIELAPGVVEHAGQDGWETGTFREAIGADRWLDAANALGVSVPEIQRFLREWRPKAAEHYDEVEAALESVDVATPDGDVVTLTHNFGSPTNRAIHAGFWTAPVLVVDAAGAEVGRVAPGVDGWSQPVVSGAIRLIDTSTSPGMHGGYVSLRVAAAEGCRCTGPVVQRDDVQAQAQVPVETQVQSQPPFHPAFAGLVGIKLQIE